MARRRAAPCGSRADIAAAMRGAATTLNAGERPSIIVEVATTSDQRRDQRRTAFALTTIEPTRSLNIEN
jgi:hypothetical protein